MSTIQDVESAAITPMLEELNTALESAIIPGDINKLIERCSLNLSTSIILKGDSKRLLANIKRMLLSDESENILDYELLLELLQSLIDVSSFDDVLEVFSTNDLLDALNSGITSIVRAACKIISKSYPKGIFASSLIIDIVLEIFFNLDTEISIINDIETLFKNLSSDELIRRRILVNNHPLLKKIKRDFEPKSFTRLIELLKIEYEFITPSEFDESLFVITINEIRKSIEKDIFIFISITNYYTSLVANIDAIGIHGTNHMWVISSIESTVYFYGDLFANLETYFEVKNFGLSYMFELFRQCSYQKNGELFHTIDKAYVKLSHDTPYILEFMAFVNPKYLFKFHQTLVHDFALVTPSRLGILRNIMADPDCFLLIEPKITSGNILALPYMEQMVLLEKMTQFKYGVEYLIQFLPQVMANLTQNLNGEVTEPETVELRREAVEHLLQFGEPVLNVWYNPLRKLYGRIVNGDNYEKKVEPKLASAYL
ncbi:Hsm3p NDAI_0B04720 [Naumovozyma dairenensis CBS 421]|uniref:DNA mismatch repair protein HSM3 n=1 Tax=Naumovozyma dairenensis (strain ATCC 10597 / BCRC 20456 / CBS 421 / NBRC 0211 / NRRL Y-12639) TaxID=1071378 RepID=G0W6U6_NAUDC|nr:hypothetical protein NDAI_0B04720 [Naumovozyma dairenensis CBS 421]CCD23507.1 hypothetical protein NDAI_0B04720 [Naumovozyma dairenensis CBS 421]